MNRNPMLTPIKHRTCT